MKTTVFKQDVQIEADDLVNELLNKRTERSLLFENMCPVIWQLYWMRGFHHFHIFSNGEWVWEGVRFARGSKMV